MPGSCALAESTAHSRLSRTVVLPCATGTASALGYVHFAAVADRG